MISLVKILNEAIGKPKAINYTDGGPWLNDRKFPSGLAYAYEDEFSSGLEKFKLDALWKNTAYANDWADNYNEYREIPKEENLLNPKVLKKPNIKAERSERTTYYIDLENTLYLGTEEEYAKQLAATYVAVVHDEYRKYGDWNMATKKANTILKTKFTTMNPNKASLFKSSKEGKINSLKFIKWLQKHPEAKDLTKRLFEIEAEYKERLEKYNSKIPYYWSKLNIKDLLADFDWS